MSHDQEVYDELENELMDAERSLSGTRRHIRDKISRIKMGTYDEQRDGNLLEVLEEIERILR